MRTLVSLLFALGAALLLGTAAAAQTCAEALRVCETSLSAVTVELEAALRDSDDDRVRDVDDQCPATADGVSVDGDGCSNAQFCARQAVTATRERQVCRRLDWNNDEPAKAVTRDCRPVQQPGSRTWACKAVSGDDAPSSCVAVEIRLDYPEDFEPVGATIALQYPASVSIPGFGNDPSVLARVENRTGISNGLFAVGDSEGFPATLRVGLISLQQVIPRGAFAVVHFDCTPGEPRPGPVDFACIPDLSDVTAIPVPATCEVIVD